MVKKNLAEKPLDKNKTRHKFIKNANAIFCQNSIIQRPLLKFQVETTSHLGVEHKNISKKHRNLLRITFAYKMPHSLLNNSLESWILSLRLERTETVTHNRSTGPLTGARSK